MDEVLKIIIADDNYALVDFMKRILEEDKRFEVVGIATNDEEEINLIEREKPNVVITDLKKKNEYTGLNIIEEFKNKEYKPLFFIVSAMATGYIEEMRRLNIDYYLNKPFNDKTFIEKMDRIYEEIYPKRIMIIGDNKIKYHRDNFFERFCSVVKRRVGI